MPGVIASIGRTNMSINPISTSATSSTSDTRSERATAFNSLATALKNGDLSGAQKAFATLQSYAPKKKANDNDGDESNGSDPVKSGFDSLGSALKSGDLSAAQQAFSSIQSNLRSGHHRHHASTTDANGSESPSFESPSVIGSTISVAA